MKNVSEIDLAVIPAKDRFDYLLETVRERIICLQYAPGTRIGEEELAGEFGVSRTPIRRVLSRLEYEEFVEIRQGAGTYITEVNWSDLTDAYEMRMHLTELIGVLNPQQLDCSDIEQLYRIRDSINSRGNDLTAKEYRRLNAEFQAKISKCIGNRQLRKSINRLYFVTQRHWMVWQPEMDWENEIWAFHRQVADIIRCVEIGDIKGVGLVWRNVIFAMISGLEKTRTKSIQPEKAAGTLSDTK